MGCAGAYYNENDRQAVEWLRELIKAGVIAPGDVDERSITEVRASDLIGYRQCHFFAGIGGWSYALRLARWDDSRPVWTGSCPCQPFSDAGKGLGEKDARHLWPVFRELIQEGQPTVCFGEQVASEKGRKWLAGVFADLEAMEYRRAGADLCAAGVKAPHRRQRLYWVAYAKHRNGRGEQQQREQREHRRPGPAGSGAALSLGNPDGAGCGEQGGPVTIQSEQLSAERGGDAGSMAEPDGGKSGNGELQRSREQRQQPQDGGVMPMDDSAGTRCNRKIREAEGETRDETRMRVLGAGRQVSGMGDTESGGCGEQRDAAFAGSSRHVERADWSRFDIIGCRDGKARRVEAGTFPLDHGIPGRVGLLRGYGNAIVPEVAAEFIEACEGALFDCSC